MRSQDKVRAMPPCRSLFKKRSDAAGCRVENIAVISLVMNVVTALVNRPSAVAPVRGRAAAAKSYLPLLMPGRRRVWIRLRV